MKNKTIKFADLSAKWVNTPYMEYCSIEKKGCDCLTLLFGFMKEYGYKIPKEFQGITMSNYFKIWDENRKKAISILKDLLNEITIEKNIKDLKIGDIIICNHTKVEETFFTIYAGNGKCFLTTHAHGVNVVPLRFIKIINVYKGYH